VKILQYIINGCKQNILLIGILLCSAGLLFPGIFHGLPTYPDADEPFIIAIAVKIIKGDLNPHFFNYPSLSLYFYAVVVGFTNIVYHLLALLNLTHSDYTPYWLFFAVGRVFTASTGIVIIILVYKIGRMIFSRRAALYAAAIMATLPIQFSYTTRVSPNALLFLIATISIFFSIKYYKENSVRFLYYSAIAAGLALGTKYLFLSPVSFLIAKYLNDIKHKRRFFNGQLFYACTLVVVAFFISTPFLFVSLQGFIRDVFFEYKHYSTGHPGNESPNAFAFFGTYLFYQGISPVLFLCACTGIFYCFFKKLHECLIVFSVPVVWFLFCSLFTVTSVHNIAIISTVFALGAAIIINMVKNPWIRFPLFLLMIIIPVYKDSIIIRDRIKPDIRYVAEEWINTNLPEGSFIAREEYTPFYSSSKFKSEYIGICGLAYMPLDTVRQKGYDYIISAGYKRFDADTIKYSENIKNFTENLKKFKTVKTFDPGSKYQGNSIKVLKKN